MCEHLLWFLFEMFAIYPIDIAAMVANIEFAET
jgi:hypothetical protein